MTDDEKRLNEVYDRVAGILADEGWPSPYARIVTDNNNPQSYVLWRKGKRGSAVSLSTYFRYNPDQMVMRHAVRVHGFLDERWILTDGGEIYITGDNPEPSHIVAALRLFRSVIE